MKANSNKCVDLNGGTGNGTGLIINDCDGSSDQSWKFTPDVQSGAFTIKSVSTGRCIDVSNYSWNNYVQMQLWDCNGQDNQKFNIKATP
jgi:endo-1,4-beta-xylanase